MPELQCPTSFRSFPSPIPAQGSPLCPHLVLVASCYGVRLALLNGRLSGDDVTRWHSYRAYRSLLTKLVSKFDIIVPSSDQVSAVHSPVLHLPTLQFSLVVVSCSVNTNLSPLFSAL